MPVFERDRVSIYYEEFGAGYPILLFAPGGMRSAIEFWHRSPIDPTKDFAGEFRVIAMDQRNAGRSRGPVSAADGWQTYTGDHLALLDHLKIQRCAVMGGCIGSSYCLSIIKAAPERISAAVLQNPIGLHENRAAFREMFDGWAKELQSKDKNLSDNALTTFRESMYGGDFVFSVTRDFVRSCTTPMILLSGEDLYHPAPISEEIARLAPNIEVVKEWKSADAARAASEKVRGFLKKHSEVNEPPYTRKWRDSPDERAVYPPGFFRKLNGFFWIALPIGLIFLCFTGYTAYERPWLCSRMIGDAITSAIIAGISIIGVPSYFAYECLYFFSGRDRDL